MIDLLRRAGALLALLAVGVLTAGLIGCGGNDDEGDGAASSAPAETRSGQEPTEGDAGSGGDGAAAGQRAGGSGGDGGDGGSEPGPGATGGRVDLTVDPARIDGAIVTETGAVQTLPPREEAHRTAQENSYSSIKAFGEEAEGEEATEITFGLVQYLTAKAEGEWATACARLYSPLRESIEKLRKDGAGCAEIFGELMSRVPKASRAEAARIDVSSIRRGEDNRAFVIYKTPDTVSADMPMYFEDGIWKVGAVEAYVLTPEQLREAGRR